jgi:hypothetical protein
MGRRGPNPAPNELKRLRGRPGHHPLPPVPLTLIAPANIQVIDPPGAGDDLLQAVLEGPARAWIAQADSVVVQQLRDSWAERCRLRRAAADLEPGWETGRYQPAVLVRLAQVEKDVTGWLSLLGLTPSDRSRLGVAEVRAQSKLDALRERRAGRSRAG